MDYTSSCHNKNMVEYYTIVLCYMQNVSNGLRGTDKSVNFSGDDVGKQKNINLTTQHKYFF